jgi:hypothetical protein
MSDVSEKNTKIKHWKINEVLYSSILPAFPINIVQPPHTCRTLQVATMYVGIDPAIVIFLPQWIRIPTPVFISPFYSNCIHITSTFLRKKRISSSISRKQKKKWKTTRKEEPRSNSLQADDDHSVEPRKWVRRRRRKKNPNKQNGGGASAKSFVALRLHRPLLFFFTFTNFHSFSHSLETEGLLWPLHAKRPVFNNNRLECQNDVNRFLFYGKIR